MSRVEFAPDVPFAWLSAQESAGELIEARRPAWRRPSFEYRAVHDVLALTTLLAGEGEMSTRPDERQLLHFRTLLGDEFEWFLWCRDRLGAATPGVTEADLAQAGRAWRWLTESRSLGNALGDPGFLRDEPGTLRGAALCVGIREARRLLDGLAAR